MARTKYRVSRIKDFKLSSGRKINMSKISRAANVCFSTVRENVIEIINMLMED